MVGKKAANSPLLCLRPIAVIRSEGARPEGERLFEDRFAALFGAAGAHAIEGTQRYLSLPFVRDGVRLRTPGTRVVFAFGHRTFGDETAAARTARADFSSCEELGLDEVWRRYLPGEPHPNAWVSKVGTACAD